MPWTEAEDRVLREVYPVQGSKACSRRLPHRSPQSVRQRAYRLDLSRGWTAEEERVLREVYPRGGARPCCALLPARSFTAIRHRAVCVLGLRIAPGCEVLRGRKVRAWREPRERAHG